MTAAEHPSVPEPAVEPERGVDAGSTGRPEDDPVVRIAQELIRFDTSNLGAGRSHGETEAAEYVAAYLTKLGLQPEIIEVAPRRTSVIARLTGSDPERPALVLHGHLDVVPAVAEDWSVDPFGGVVKDGYLWGRGAVDMKNVDAMILSAVEILLAAGERPRRDVILAFFSDEENGGVFGSHPVVAQRPELFAGATEAISEVGGYSIDVEGKTAYLVQTGEKAMMWLTLRAKGTAGHGSTLGIDNAVTRLSGAVERIGAHPWPTRLTATVHSLLEGLSGLTGRPVDLDDPHDLIGRTGTAGAYLAASLRTTANPTGLKAGYKHNVIPGEASAMIDVRTAAGTEDEVLATLAELAGPGVEIEMTHRDVGFENPVEGELIDLFQRLLEDADPGAVALPYLMPAGTDNKALSLLGIRGYGFAPLKLPVGFDFMSMFHGVDERVPLDALVFGRDLYVRLLREA